MLVFGGVHITCEIWTYIWLNWTNIHKPFHDFFPANPRGISSPILRFWNFPQNHSKKFHQTPKPLLECSVLPTYATLPFPAPPADSRKRRNRKTNRGGSHNEITLDRDPQSPNQNMKATKKKNPCTVWTQRRILLYIMYMVSYSLKWKLYMEAIWVFPKIGVPPDHPF